MLRLIAALAACRDAPPSGRPPPPVGNTAETAQTADTAPQTDTVACDPTNEGCDAASWLVTCTDEEVGTMLPGSDCMACHLEEHEEVADDPSEWWTVAGTVFLDDDGGAPAPGVRVHVEDPTGRDVDLDTDAAGNFHTVVYFVPPLSVALESPDGALRTLPEHADSGSCNGCHACAGAAGRKLFAP
jgi:hypothetical protein